MAFPGKMLEFEKGKISCGDPVGYGRFSVVFKAIDQHTGSVAALRISPTRPETQVICHLLSSNELFCYRLNLLNPNVSEDMSFWIMPLMETNLQQLVFEKSVFFHPAEILSLVAQISKGLELLTKKDFVHGSLNPKYVLLDRTQTEMTKGRRCVTSFRSCIAGLHKCLPVTAAPSRFKWGQYKDQYTAPEVGKPFPLDASMVDSFAVEVIAYELIALWLNLHTEEMQLSKTDDATDQQRIEMLFHQSENHYLNELKQIITDLTKFAVNERWSIQDINNYCQADEI